MDSDDELLLSIPEEQLGVPRVSQVPKTKKSASWVTSAFDDFSSTSVTKGKTSFTKSKSDVGTSAKCKTVSRDGDGSSTRPYAGKQRNTKVEKGSLWAEQYAPTNLCELAVHKKKVADVQGWLQLVFAKNKPMCPMLLLTGPSGAGKTATVQTLAYEMHYEIFEWINPVAEAYHALDQATDFTPRRNQAQQFQDFILRANKYEALQMLGSDHQPRRVILVEDFPNVFYRETSGFHEILRHYRRCGQCPLVFIVSDSVAGESVERRLFPKDKQAELQMSNISFNPVAQTSLVKVLAKIAASQCRSRDLPDRCQLDALTTASGGDLRAAINALQFSWGNQTDSQSLSSGGGGGQRHHAASKRSRSGRSKSTKTGAAEKAEAAAVGGRDTTLFLFRALGKILYCKRGLPADFPDHPHLPEHLQDYERDPLLIEPEDVVEKSHMPNEMFTAYLQENYLEFYPLVDDIVSASSYLSDADTLLKDWQWRSQLSVYASSVSARCIAYCNTARSRNKSAASLGWKPLHKPHSFAANKLIRSNCAALKDLFKGQGCSPVQLQTEVLPYAALIRPPSSKPGQQHCYQTIGRIAKKRFFSERLDEKDVAVEDDEDEPFIGVQLNRASDPTPEPEPEEDHVQIDDFDD